MNNTGPISTVIFTTLVVLIVMAVAILFRRADYSRKAVGMGLVVWLAFGALAAWIGQTFGPEALFVGLIPVAVVSIVVALSPMGKTVGLATPLALLAAFQVFRFPLELILHEWYNQGVVAIQLTYLGDNLDILIGLAAIPVALAIWKGWAARPVAWAFNVIGLVFLFRIIWIVSLSSPTPLRAVIGGYETGPDILLGMTVPHVWIATVAVFSAIMVHAISLRVLWETRKDQPNG